MALNNIISGIGTGLNLLNVLKGIAQDATNSQQGAGDVNTGLDIDSFRTHFSNHLEVSKSDKFDVYIPIPDAVAGEVSMEDLALQCEVSELPGKDINMIEFRHYGFTRRIPHINQYNHISFTFICAGDLLEKRLFDRWMDFMCPAQTGIVRYPMDNTGQFVYASQIAINQRDNMNNIAYTINLFNAMPISVSPMSQSWQDDSIHRLTVTFAYEKWTSSETIFTSPPSTLGGTTSQSPTSIQPSTNPLTNFNNGSVIPSL